MIKLLTTILATIALSLPTQAQTRTWSDFETYQIFHGANRDDHTMVRVDDQGGVLLECFGIGLLSVNHHPGTDTYRIYDPLNQQWSTYKISGVSPERGGCRMVYAHNLSPTPRVFFHGGIRPLATSVPILNDTWAVDVNGTQSATFTLLATGPTIHGYGAFWEPNLQRMILVGESGATPNMHMFDPSNNTWTPLPNSVLDANLQPIAVGGGSIVLEAHTGIRWMFGCHDSTGKVINKTFAWDFATYKWYEIATVGSTGLAFSAGTYDPIQRAVVSMHGTTDLFATCQTGPISKKVYYLDSTQGGWTLAPTDDSGAIVYEERFHSQAEFVAGNPGYILLTGGRNRDGFIGCSRRQPSQTLFLSRDPHTQGFGINCGSLGFSVSTAPQVGGNYVVDLTTNPVVSNEPIWMAWGRPILAPFQGCILYNDGFYEVTSLGLTSAAGTAQYTTLIPNSPVFVGLAISQQAWMIEQGSQVWHTSQGIYSIIRR